jgi:hypothetical protein
VLSAQKEKAKNPEKTEEEKSRAGSKPALIVILLLEKI